MSILVVAGIFALISALAGDVVGAVIGLLVAGAGAMELHGVTLLHHFETRGMNWLWGSQIFLLASILGYCAFQLARTKLPELPPEVQTLIQQDADQLGMSVAEFLRMFNRMLYSGVAVATLFYQGGMALYYLRRRATIRRALEGEI